MAEELQAQATAVETADSQESSPSTSEKPEKRQPKPEVVSIEDFRKFQAAKDREASLAIQRAKQAESRMQQLENEIFQLRIQDRPEDEQQIALLQRQLQQASKRAVDAEQYAAWLQEQSKKQQQADAALVRVATKTGFPIEDARKIFMETGDADAVWEAAHEWASDGRRSKRKADEDEDDPGTQRAKANRVDTGTGKASPNDRSALIRKAIADRDSDSFYRAMLAKK
jgi:hypothetical protein